MDLFEFLVTVLVAAFFYAAGSLILNCIGDVCFPGDDDEPINDEFPLDDCDDLCESCLADRKHTELIESIQFLGAWLQSIDERLKKLVESDEQRGIYVFSQ